MSTPASSQEPIDGAAHTRVHVGGLTGWFIDGDLRDVRWHGSPVVQRIYMAVRDRAWNTIPATMRNTTLVQSEDAFIIEFDAVNQYEDIDFEWHGRIDGGSDGTLSYTWTGRAARAFEYCKIGLNVHHARDAYLGKPFTIRTRQGLVSGEFGADIVPQLVRDGTLTAMTDYFDELTVSIEGAVVTLAFDGDLFELQDHRNWADANWKSYGTPLSFGFPMTIAPGESLGQSVRVSASGTGVVSPDDATPVTCWLDQRAALRLPRIGHLWSQALNEGEFELLRSTRPDHLRIDLHPETLTSEWLDDVTALCASLGCNLEVGAFIRPESVDADSQSVARALAMTSVPIDRVLVLQESGGFSEFGGAAPAAMAQAVARALTKAGISARSIVSGTPQSFNDLNRARPDYSSIDGLVFALNPQVHASDDDSLMQNTKAIPDIVDFARRLFGQVAVVLSPVDLIGAHGPYPAGPMAPAGRAVNEDPRQWTSFGAAWTLAALAEMVSCNTTSATMFELSGRRGLVDATAPSSIRQFLSDLARVQEWSLIGSGTSAPDRLALLAFRRGEEVRAAIANLTSQPVTVHWNRADTGIERDVVPLSAYEVRWCDVGTSVVGPPAR